MYQVTNKSIVLFSIASLFSYNVFALNESLLNIDRSSLMVPERLGKLSLVHDEEGFHIVKGDEVHPIKKYWVDKKIRNMKREQLSAFLAGGYLAVSQFNDGDYKIEAKTRGLGGGPVLGWILYTVTKGTCYGTAAAAIGGAVVATGGALAGAGSVLAASASAGTIAAAGTTTAASLAVTGAATGTIAGAAALTGGTAIGVAAATSATIGATAGAASTAGLVTAGAVSAGGGIAGAVAAVESVSVGAWLVGNAIWFLP